MPEFSFSALLCQNLFLAFCIDPYSLSEFLIWASLSKPHTSNLPPKILTMHKELQQKSGNLQVLLVRPYMVCVIIHAMVG